MIRSHSLLRVPTSETFTSFPVQVCSSLLLGTGTLTNAYQLRHNRWHLYVLNSSLNHWSTRESSNITNQHNFSRNTVCLHLASSQNKAGLILTEKSEEERHYKFIKDRKRSCWLLSLTITNCETPDSIHCCVCFIYLFQNIRKIRFALWKWRNLVTVKICLFRCKIFTFNIFCMFYYF